MNSYSICTPLAQVQLTQNDASPYVLVKIKA